VKNTGEREFAMKKSVLISGSSRGIGLDIAKVFLAAGYNVCLNCKTDYEKMEVEVFALNAARDKKAGNTAIGFRADVTDYSSCERMAEYVKKKTGSIDVLINNAAVSYVGLFHEMTAAEYNGVINGNLLSVMNLSHVVLPEMIKNHSGCIINISSVWGKRGSSCEAAYSASKGGVNAFTKSLAKELGPSGIRVNGISCGVIDTDMNNWLSETEKDDLINQTALLRFGSPREIAKTALFLASDNASYITGEVLNADGGM
jgi:3-oxoacyl-[acyl-carrier protein] reductase